MAVPTKQESRMVTVFSSTSVTCAASAYSNGIDLTQSCVIGLWYRALPTSAASGVRVWYEESYQDTDSLYCIPEGGTDIVLALNDSLPHVALVTLPPMRYTRIGATCGSAASTDLNVTIIAFVQ